MKNSGVRQSGEFAFWAMAWARASLTDGGRVSAVALTEVVEEEVKRVSRVSSEYNRRSQERMEGIF